MKRAVALFALFVSVFAQTAASPAQGTTDTVTPEARLLGAMKLWGDIRLFDPQVAEGRTDWDAAFMNAEPAILAATTRDSYVAAIRQLLSPLNDPGTRPSGAYGDTFSRVSAAPLGSASVITIEHGTSETLTAFQTAAASAVATASKSRDVIFDLRGVSEANNADSDALNFFFSGLSPITALLSGEVAFPRARTRQYLGYPDESGYGYQGYSAEDNVGDAEIVEGKSKTSHRFGFLVDGTTSLPTLALASGLGERVGIYTTGAQPAVLTSGSEQIDLPDGVQVSYRIADLADIAESQPFATSRVSGVAEALARLQTQASTPATYAAAPSERFINKAYPENTFPPEPMRMLAVARIYNNVRYFSPYVALMHDDWDAAALQAIRDERAATDTRSYILGLLKFYAYLHDSHGGFPQGKAIQSEFGFGPPIDVRFLHGEAVVTNVLAGSATMQGLQVGDVIDAVDNVRIRQAMNAIERYICSSTPQSADFSALRAAYEPSVFSGRKGTTVELQFHHLGQRASLTATYVRQAYAVKPPPKSRDYFVLPGNVGYVAFDQLEPSEVDAMFAALRNTRAIIFDNRGYPKGTAWSIAPRLTTATSLRLALFNTPYVIEPLGQPQGEADYLPTYHQFYQMMEPAAGARYLKPTVMLIDERAISQSEHSALFFRATGHTRFVGTPTRGANGDVTAWFLPGGLRFAFSGEGVRWPDGRQLQRVGIIPDVRVEPTARDIATANDVVLQRGLDEALRLSGASAGVRKAALRQELAREHIVSR
jgi:C-terminal processing protease CtpA/Prc